MVLCAMKMRGLYRAGENFKNRKESEDEDDEDSGDGGGRGIYGIMRLVARIVRHDTDSENVSIRKVAGRLG